MPLCSELTGTTTGSMSGACNMVDVKPIRTEADYEAALAEVERLWGAKLGTPQGDQLDLLATLIDAYEGEYHSIDAPGASADTPIRKSRIKRGM